MIFFFSLFFSFTAQAVTLEVSKGGQLLFSAQEEVYLPMPLGKITVDLFDKYQVPYEGNMYGLSKIFDVEQTLEFPSDKEIKSYGWCFYVNGVLMANEFPGNLAVHEQNTVIRWVYSYEYFDGTDWVGQCQEVLP